MMATSINIYLTINYLEMWTFLGANVLINDKLMFSALSGSSGQIPVTHV